MSDVEDAAVEEQVEVPKKGRGAPKKDASKVKATEKSEDEPPAKRGRGRPPGRKAAGAKPAAKSTKQTTEAGNGEVQDAGEAIPKRRGRPAKVVPAKPESEEEDDAGDEEESDIPAKAKNGKAGAQKAAKNGHSEVEESDQDGDVEEGKSEAASSDSRIKIVVEHW